MRHRIKDLDYSNIHISQLIDDRIHNIRDRAALKLRFVDGMTYDEIASEMCLSYERVKKFIYKGEQTLLPYILKEAGHK